MEVFYGTATECHLPHGITQCYLPATRHKWTHPALTPAMQAGTRFTYPGGTEGWVDLVDLIAPRPGVEPATYLSVWTRLVSMPISCRVLLYRKDMNTIYKVYDVVCYIYSVSLAIQITTLLYCCHVRTTLFTTWQDIYAALYHIRLAFPCTLVYLNSQYVYECTVNQQLHRAYDDVTRARPASGQPAADVTDAMLK